jgi:hypothetical protein
MLNYSFEFDYCCQASAVYHSAQQLPAAVTAPASAQLARASGPLTRSLLSGETCFREQLHVDPVLIHPMAEQANKLMNFIAGCGLPAAATLSMIVLNGPPGVPEPGRRAALLPSCPAHPSLAIATTQQLLSFSS